MRLKEVLPELLFVCNNEIKCKWFEFNNSSTSICYSISFNLLNFPIKKSLSILRNPQNINNNQKVTLWNISNLELDFFYYDKWGQWFLYNEKNQKFYNFSCQHKNIFVSKVNNKNQNFFYKGKIKFDVINGEIDEKSIIFNANNDNWMEISKINGLLFKELNSFDNMAFNKKCLLNINFDSNLLLKYINEFNNEYLKGSDATSFEIKQTLKIIKYCILQSDFYNCLNNIRSIRNLIFAYINEEIFHPIYLNLEILIDRELLWRKDYLKQLQENEKNNEYQENEIKKTENIINNNEQKLNKIINWYKQFKKINDIKDDYEIAQSLINERKEYYKQSIYFFQEIFENLTEEKFSPYQVENSKIINFIENKILNEDELISFKTANLLTNNSVHKNNYDRESYEGWYLNSHELNILKETLKIYLNIFIKFQNNISSYKQEIEELEKGLKLQIN
ncbi:hypothetical protein LT336_00695 [Spiroplasma sp. JKS002671]|uniref:hypothetical protein n=1 Tax=Spiroplasma attinicola TaxID=2904537 RepID=UPI002022A06B|nr:hypothetical protein [Spiroplasma sp. JKS002671]MCL8210951.1 hypothetical protein [Spiroplasma sp. JKS002671]